MHQAHVILIVEDDFHIATTYRYKLELDGFHVIVARDGLDALSRTKQNKQIDAILLDLKMPRMNGDVFLEKIRAMDKYAFTPVYILTNIGKEEAPKTIWHLNIEEYIVKVMMTPREISEKLQAKLGKIES